MTVDELAALPWSKVVVADNPVFAASILELPGCFAEGGTREEALSNLDDALKSWLETAIEMGYEIPHREEMY